MKKIYSNDAKRLDNCEQVLRYLSEIGGVESPVFVSIATLASKTGLSTMEVRTATNNLISSGHIKKTKGGRDGIIANAYKVINPTDPVWKLSPVAETLLNLLWAVDIVHGPNRKIARAVGYGEDTIALGWKQLRQAGLVYNPNGALGREGLYLLTGVGRREARRRNSVK